MRLIQLNAFNTLKQKISAGYSEKWLRRMLSTVGSNLLVSNNLICACTFKTLNGSIILPGNERTHVQHEAGNRAKVAQQSGRLSV